MSMPRKLKVLSHAVATAIMLAGSVDAFAADAGPTGPAGPRGPAGATGPAGAMGPRGVQGLPGPAGAKGPAGAVGARGLTGQQGATGARGATGPAGVAGPRGSVGPMGPTGPVGEKGQMGPQGEKGEKGQMGPRGDKGEMGQMGPVGEKGEMGPMGEKGEMGPTGPTGAAGLNGNDGATGATGPTGPAGTGGISASGYYELATIADNTVVGGADIPLSHNGPQNGTLHTPNTTTIWVPNAGVYQISYSVNIMAGVGSQIAIAVNGTVHPSTPITALVATGQVSGTALLELTAGDIITLRNNSATPLVMTLAPGVGAQVNLIKIGDLPNI